LALFPNCSFRVLLPNGVVTPGERLEGTLVLHAPKGIPNARRIELCFRTTAKAKYSRQYPSFPDHEMFVDRSSLALPAREPFAQGEHRLAFAFDVPPWLPPQHEGPGYSIEHAFDARLEVAWGLNPTKRFTPRSSPDEQEIQTTLRAGSRTSERSLPRNVTPDLGRSSFAARFGARCVWSVAPSRIASQSEA